MRESHVRAVNVLGHPIRVSIRPGTQEGVPLLLCNGIGASLDVLQPFVDAIDPRLEVISFDVPGVGGSPLPKCPYNFTTLAWGLGRMLRTLDHDRFDVLGISWGGGLAQQVAFQFPRRCRRAVFVSTGTGCLMVPARPSVLWKLATPRRHRDPSYAVDVAPSLYGGSLRQDPAMAQVLHHNSRAGSWKGYLLQLLAGAGWSSLGWLPLIRQPALVLAGSDDPIVPLVNARIMSRLLHDGRLHIYDDGHLALITRAQELAPVVYDFLSE